MGLNMDFNALKKALAEKEKKIQTKISKRALEAGANVIKEKQKDLTPVDTGELQSYIDKSKVKTKRGAKKIDIGLVDAPEDVKLYGHYQNYGYRGEVGKFFMQEAFETSKNTAVEKMANIIKENL